MGVSKNKPINSLSADWYTDDKYLKKYLNMPNKILKVGIAFSFQKYHNLPSTRNDVKLDHIITEKGII